MPLNFRRLRDGDPIPAEAHGTGGLLCMWDRFLPKKKVELVKKKMCCVRSIAYEKTWGW